MNGIVAAAAWAAKGQFPSFVTRRRPSFRACVPREYGATLDVQLRVERFRMKTGTKALCIHFGCCLDSIEADLPLAGLLFLEHPQMTHSP